MKNLFTISVVVICSLVAGIEGNIPNECTCLAHGYKGETVYKSCDGAYITFGGSCEYKLMETCFDEVEASDPDKKPNFSVIVKSQFTTENENDDTFDSGLTVRFLENEIKMSTRGGIMVNSQLKTPDYISDRFNITRKDTPEVTFVELETDFRLKVLIHLDSRSHRFRVKVGHRYRKSLCGLCGNYNARSHDDYRLADGTDVAGLAYVDRQDASEEIAASMVVHNDKEVEMCVPVVLKPSPEQVLQKMIDDKRVSDLYGSCEDGADKSEGRERCDVTKPDHPTHGSFGACLEILKKIDEFDKKFVDACSAAYCAGSTRRDKERHVCYYIEALSRACHHNMERVSGWCEQMKCPAIRGCEKWEPPLE